MECQECKKKIENNYWNNVLERIYHKIDNLWNKDYMNIVLLLTIIYFIYLFWKKNN